MRPVVRVVRTEEEIKAAIARLSLEQRAELVAELCGWQDDDWDRQMKADASAGTCFHGCARSQLATGFDWSNSGSCRHNFLISQDVTYAESLGGWHLP